jgi:hypothetical protein
MQFTVLVNRDGTFENNEAFTAHLGNAIGATIGDMDGTGTLMNDDTAPTVQFSSAGYADDESQSAVITITRTGDSALMSTVLISTADNTATGGAVCTLGVDYITVTGQTVTFGPFINSQTINVALCPDMIAEPAQTVDLALTNPSGGTLGTQNTAVLTINDTANAYRNTSVITITGNAAANPYPSTINITGAPAIVGAVRVTLYDLSHSFPDNIDILLVGPNGNEYVLMGDAGGPFAVDVNTPVTLTFTDSAGAVLPDSNVLVTGVYKPTTWETPVSNFPVGAPAGPYVEPGNTLSRPVEQSMFGNFGLQVGNGTWSLYVRDDNGMLAPSAVLGEITGGWGIELLAPTAAGVELSGRVMTPDGRGLRNARVRLTGEDGATRTAITGSFGYYRFEDVATGETYVMSVASKRYSFDPRVVQVFDTLSDVDFVGRE